MVESVRPTSRRQFLVAAASMGATAAWASQWPGQSDGECCERRDLYPEGVASGDPDPGSVLLWTRRPFVGSSNTRLRVEVAEDPAFRRVMASAHAQLSAESDWTCRVLVGNLRPAQAYWYRFIDEEGNASRVGRTLTAPAASDSRPVRFAFASCQNANIGALHAYRRMIFEDERAPENERIGFVLHLGDFVYESIWYPDDNPRGAWGRPLRDIVRYRDGERIRMGPNVGDFHIPTTLDDYRALYRAYLRDTDLQDARARWPFVCMWDNHEFSWSGWQSVQTFNGTSRATPSRKVAANQAWFEYQPARIATADGKLLERFDAPRVHDDARLESFDDQGFCNEPNNRAAVASLKGYRALRWGRHVELILTDQHSYRSQPPGTRPEAAAFSSDDFPLLVPQEVTEILDAGRAYAKGKPPAKICVGVRETRNFRQHEAPQTILGAEQKQWFLTQLQQCRATWKIWGNTKGTLEQRADLQNLPAGLGKPWPGAGYAISSGGNDHSTAYLERAEIYETVRAAAITGFVTLCGDRHSFWAGYAAPALPPRSFDPVGVVFVTGSISMLGTPEYLEQTLPGDHPLRALFLTEAGPHAQHMPALNLLNRHGVRTCLEYQRTGDLPKALSLSNTDLAPHLKFLDHGGHGYSVVRASADALDCEFVCIPRPIAPVAGPEGGPLLYRVVHRTPLWKKGEHPRLEQRVVEGNPTLSL